MLHALAGVGALGSCRAASSVEETHVGSVRDGRELVRLCWSAALPGGGKCKSQYIIHHAVWTPM